MVDQVTCLLQQQHVDVANCCNMQSICICTDHTNNISAASNHSHRHSWTELALIKAYVVTLLISFTLQWQQATPACYLYFQSKLAPQATVNIIGVTRYVQQVLIYMIPSRLSASSLCITLWSRSLLLHCRIELFMLLVVLLSKLGEGPNNRICSCALYHLRHGRCNGFHDDHKRLQMLPCITCTAGAKEVWCCKAAPHDHERSTVLGLLAGLAWVPPTHEFCQHE